MRHDPQKYLYDVCSACEFLLQFTAGRTVDDYTRDRGFARRWSVSCRSLAKRSFS